MSRPRRAARSSRPVCASRSARPSCSTASTSPSTEGTIFALLGPNGAGKTTIVRILSTLIPRRRGRAAAWRATTCVDDPDGVRAAIGVTGQFSAVDELLTGEENLQLMADLNRLGRAAGRRRVAELLERFDLVDAAGRPASTYSGGMRRRLDLAMTLVGSPRVIFLDEPTTGLDPRSRRTDVGRHPRAGRRRRDDPPHHPVPRRGRRARRSDRRPRPRPHRRRGHPRRAQAAHPRRPRRACSSPTRRPCARPPPCSTARTPDEERLELQRVRATAASHRCATARAARRRPDRGRAALHPHAPTSTTSSSP